MAHGIRETYGIEPVIPWRLGERKSVFDSIGYLKMTMLLNKNKVLEIINNLPEDCSYDDIIYALYFNFKVECGLDDMKKGRLLTHDDVENMVKNMRRV